jgi:hypothetical protein
MYGTSNNFFGQLVGGLVIIMLLIPSVVKSLSRGNINLNGLTLDVAETVLETITQRDWNFGDESRVDSNWEGPN